MLQVHIRETGAAIVSAAKFIKFRVKDCWKVIPAIIIVEQIGPLPKLHVSAEKQERPAPPRPGVPAFRDAARQY